MKQSIKSKTPTRRKYFTWRFAYLYAALPSVVLAVVSIWTPMTKAQALPADAKPTCIASAPLFASWFESGTVTLNGVVKPADSVLFPNTPNCSFYQWSEQMFLWLASPAPRRYGGGGRIFDSPVFYDVSPPDAMGERTFIPHTPGKLRFFNLRAAQVGKSRLPIVFDKSGRLLEVELPTFSARGKQLIKDKNGKEVEIERATFGPTGKPILLDRAGKTISSPKALLSPRTIATQRAITQPGVLSAHTQLNLARTTVQKVMVAGKPVFFDGAGNVIEVEQGQAGGGDVLQAQNGSLVYFVTMVNDVYAYFLTGTKNGGITPTPTRFPTTQANLDKITAFATAHGKTLVDPEALAVEVKSSWVEAAGLPNLNSYITMTATIPTYDTSNPNQWIPNGQKTVKLAMVGIHVVGSTAGHPEMIWATFEHFGVAPNAAYRYVDNANVTKTVLQNTAGTWLFSATGSAGPFNESHMFFNSPNIDAISPFTVSASDTIRSKAFGAAFDFAPNPLVTSAASNTEVIAINNSVIGQLVAGDVRANYYMTGSTWTIGGAAPTGSFKGGGGGGNEVGTSKLANTTMETYQQGTNNLWATGTNCFSCHVTNTTDVSHIFAPLKPLFP